MTGVIQSINHTPGSGIATLVVLDLHGDVALVHADAGPLFRAIAVSGLHQGDEIEYTLSEFGTMSGFSVAVGDPTR